MELSGKRFLVVGGAGFIGSAVVDELLKSDVKEVIVYDNFSRGCHENLQAALRDSRVKVFEHGGEILHEEMLNAAMREVDGVFHLAAFWLLHCHEYPRSAFEVNMRGTFNVLEACIRNKVQRLVFSSSASVYGDALAEPMTEEHPFNNTTFYGASKIAGEQMCSAFHHRHKGSPQQLDYVALRYMNAYGPRQDYRGAYIAVIMKMLDRIDKGLPLLVYGDGSQAYDFIYVNDIARANICAMRAGVTDQSYNICTGVKTSIKQLAEMVLAITGSKVGIKYEPETTSFVKNRIGSTQKAARDLDFKAQVGLEEGLRSLISWRNEHKELVARRRFEAGIDA